MKSHPQSKSRIGTLCLLAAAAVASCKGGGGGCSPTDAACTAANVASLTISSPIDTVIAVGSTALLEAEARDTGGSVVAAAVSWSSSVESVATVAGTGLLSAHSAGSTVITATAGGVSTGYPMKVVDAQLTSVGVVLADALVAAAQAALSSGASADLTDVLSDCEDALLGGYVLGVNACLYAAEGVSPGDGNDQALLGVLGLFFEYSRGLLDLGP